MYKVQGTIKTAEVKTGQNLELLVVHPIAKPCSVNSCSCHHGGKLLNNRFQKITIKSYLLMFKNRNTVSMLSHLNTVKNCKCP